MKHLNIIITICFMLVFGLGAFLFYQEQEDEILFYAPETQDKSKAPVAVVPPPPVSYDPYIKGAIGAGVGWGVKHILDGLLSLLKKLVNRWGA